MKKKQGIITFKVDEELMEVMKDMPNRSAFIRQAVVTALGAICPLCNGSGMLTPNQCRHWKEFTAAHSIKRCNECNENYLVCARDH